MREVTPHYEAGAGIRPPRKSGKVRGVAREAEWLRRQIRSGRLNELPVINKGEEEGFYMNAIPPETVPVLIYPLARCEFQLRTPPHGLTPVAQYEAIRVPGPPNQHGLVVTPHVPRTGDRIMLPCPDGTGNLEYQVVAVRWKHPEYGSLDWPADTQAPQNGPLVDVIVERSGGLYADEEPGGFDASQCGCC